MPAKWISIAAVCVMSAWGQDEIRLWPDQPLIEGEVSTPSKGAKYQKLPGGYTVAHNPSLYVFLPAKGKSNGSAMVVAPGGGHRQLVMEKEGYEIAEWLNSNGIAAFVLKYRLARSPGAKYTLENEVYADAARGMRIVRSRAKEWGVDPAKIGFIGFSAGGEVAGMIGTKYDAGKPEATDPIERVSSRPDFNVLIYPSYRPGARQTGAAPLFPIGADAPPVFMVCTTEDRSHVEPTVKFYLELEEKKIPAEMHIYEAGPHGFALRPGSKKLPVDTWPDRLKEWLTARVIIP